jgi:hypothetical protein
MRFAFSQAGELDDEQPVRPLRPGIVAGHQLGPKGSIGLIVREINSQALLILSCSHVLARSGFGAQGDVIDQPTLVDDTSLQVASLTDSFSRLRTDGGNEGDFAIAAITDGIEAHAEIEGIGQPANVVLLNARSFDAFKGVSVQRLGAATGLQSGIVAGYTGPCFLSGLPVFGPTLVRYDNVVEYRTNCAPGDSGAAVVVPSTGQVLGLHVGGDPARQVGYFNPLGDVMGAFGIELVFD